MNRSLDIFSHCFDYIGYPRKQDTKISKKGKEKEVCFSLGVFAIWSGLSMGFGEKLYFG